MFWLRPILFAAGVLLFGVLIWMERRRPHRAAEGSAPRAERTEPTFEKSGSTAAGGGAASDRESRLPLPVIDWPRAETVARAGENANADEGVVSVVTEAAPQPAQPFQQSPPLVVDWPEENARRIVTLRIVAAGPERLAGRALRQGLTASGFQHGPFGIFHLPGDDGRVILSAASLVRPGILDPAAMDFQRYPGVNMFAVLPGPLSAEMALQRLGQAALELAGRVAGRVQDDTSSPFTVASSGEWRRRNLGAIGAVDAPAEPTG